MSQREEEDRHASNKWIEVERHHHPVFAKNARDGQRKLSLGHIPERSTNQFCELEREAYLLTKELEERRRIQRSRHERRPDGSSQTDGWDQELVSQINSVKVGICSMMEKR